MATTRLDLDQAAIDELPHSPEARALAAELGELIARGAQLGAPHRTGAGAASIRPDLDDRAAGWASRVGWDQLHRYMWFQEVGTKYVDEKHFLRHAFDRYARL